jgi:hypothetical protein
MRFLSSLILIFALIMPTLQLSGATINQDSLSDESNKLQVSVNAGFCNKYLWRGKTYNKGLVLQPEVAITYKDFSLSSWSNFKLWDVDGTNSNEIDFTVGYHHSFNSFDIESSLNYYHYFPVPEDNTSEFNLGIYYPLGDFTLFARSSIDILKNRGGLYGEIGFDYEKELSEKFTAFGTLLTGMASNKFNSYYLGIEKGKGAFNLASCDLGLSYSPFNRFYIDADFLLNINIDKDVKEALGSTSNMIEIVLRKEF